MAARPSGNFTDTIPLANVTVLGVPQHVSSVTLNGQAVTDGWSWDSATQVLSFTGLDSLTSDGAWNSAWELNWTLSDGGSEASGSSTIATGGSACLVAAPVMSMVAMLFSALVLL